VADLTKLLVVVVVAFFVVAIDFVNDLALDDYWGEVFDVVDDQVEVIVVAYYHYYNIFVVVAFVAVEKEIESYLDEDVVFQDEKVI
jgi:hypothetical protein